MRARIGIFLGPTLLAATLLLPSPSGLSPEGWRVAGVAMLMATWWITEAIPISATALLPLALFPLLSVMQIGSVAAPFAHPVIFLFMGGFMLAQAMQRWNLHRRLALHLIRAVGTRPRQMIGGFMLASAFLSMWVSNTATAVMMLPIGLSVIELVLHRAHGYEGPERHPFAIGLMLGIAYAASIGGIATLIGTPPNALLAGFMSETYGVEIGFAQWMLVGVPLAAIMLPLAWLALTRWIVRVPDTDAPDAAAIIDAELMGLGKPSRGEITTGVVFLGVAVAWVAQPLLETWLPWLSDAGIAMLGALLLFALPARRGVPVLDWATAARLPWDVLVLFGGGLSLAGAIRDHGLAEWMGAGLAGLGALPLIVLMLVVAAVLIFLTELTSNTASAAAFLPVLAPLAAGIGENPLFLTVPAVIAASCAFMMPVATPPNAIVYGSGHLTVPQMARAGIVLNVVFALLIPLLTFALVMLAFGARPDVLPAWALP